LFRTCSILDWKIGWRGWSLDYAVPILCVAALLVMYITAKVMRLSARDYISYFLLGGLFGIVPVLFILFDIVKVDYPFPCLGRCKHYIPGCHNNFPGRQYKGRIAQKDAYMTHISGKTS